MPKTFVQIAKEYAQHFTTSRRENGKEYTHTKDGAPEALTDLIREAHQGRGLLLPDDHRYGMIREAIDAISELDDDAGEYDARDRLAEIEPPTYMAELTAWLASRADRVGYCDEAAEEYGEAGSDTLRRITLGWLAEFREVSESVLSSLIEQADAEEGDEESIEGTR